ncbi:MAG: hypothetical protein Q8O00_04215, partial [Holophaga sp.]|nr:hypothetical protein [Holophaga sp.]
MQHEGNLEATGTPALPPPPSWVELTQSKSPRRFLSLGLCLPIYGLLLVGLFLTAPWQHQQRLGQEARLQPNAIVRLTLEENSSVDPPVLVPRADPESQFPNEPVGG